MIFTASEITKAAIMLYESDNNDEPYACRSLQKKDIKDLANITHFAARNYDEPEKQFIDILEMGYGDAEDDTKRMSSYYLIKAVGYFIRSKEKTLRETEEKSEVFVSNNR